MHDRKARKFDEREIAAGILAGERKWLSRGITLIESALKPDKAASGRLVTALLPHSGSSLRLGITGVPGVGKSTFIEAFGMHLIQLGHQVAVLSIDPSSARSGGSILGDKTRMGELSMHPSAFIRPSPSGKSLGGVAASTRESILLCEAAGYDVVIVETVGVGQSETMVKDMVDYFLLLMLPGSGDELQGIKRGIMEMADGLFINKADGNMERAKRAKKDFQNALHLFPPQDSGWTVPVDMGSALQKQGMDEVWKRIDSFRTLTTRNEWFQKNRRAQEIKWFRQLVLARLEESFFADEQTKSRIKKAEEMVSSAQWSARAAVDYLFAR